MKAKMEICSSGLSMPSLSTSKMRIKSLMELMRVRLYRSAWYYRNTTSRTFSVRLAPAMSFLASELQMAWHFSAVF